MYRRIRQRRFGASFAFACLAYSLAATALAAQPEWLKLQAPSFGVISQLDEEETRAWAVEFDQFIGAMHALYAVDQVALPPLTIVLFRQPRDFAPYRLRTDSGQARIAGFFGNTGDWCVIGMPGGGRDDATRQTIYHEAVHWFATASDTPQPLWFAEGIAEVLSTFKVIDGKGRWGQAIADNVAYLSDDGLLPMEDLLRASQDEALHGNERGKYYPQAWAFVHYLMFGNGGADAPKLAAFLNELRRTDADTAVDTAFGKSYDELTNDLRRYLERGRYGHAEIALRDRSGEMTVAPASEANVVFALGRLATVGGNLELARGHAERVITLVPGSPAGYELQAYAAHEAGDTDALGPALENAVERGSRESWIYATKADRLLIGNQRDSGPLDELLPAETARAAADLYERALELRPRNAAAFSGLIMALLNADALTETDSLAVNAGRRMFPTDGLLLVGEAATAKSRGDVSTAVQLLGQATAAPFTIPRRYRNPVVALRSSWFGEWFIGELAALTDDGRFAESRALVTRHLADKTITGPARKMLEAVQHDLPALERLHAATEAGRAGKEEEAAAILTALVNDPSAGERARREAERMLLRRSSASAEAPPSSN
jgi:tetratricopeptide (TPR) repeat protein